MRLEQLEYFAAVARVGSFRRAADELHVSQPALSEAVANLERELGVTLLERHRSGSRLSTTGRELLPLVADALAAVDRLRAAAGHHPDAGRAVRLGTVNAGTASLLLPAIQAFPARHPGVTVEIRTLQQDEIEQGLTDGSLDLGLVNLLSGDDVPPGLVGTELVRGRPVVVLPAAHPLAARPALSPDDLRGESFVGMRAGYAMHRFAHRVFGDAPPRDWHTTDGAEMGKLMVAQGMGLSVLPDYSVTGDPLELAGVLVARPIVDDRTLVRLVLEQRRGARPSAAVRALGDELVAVAARRSVPRA
ncbi:LysR family transcriptional regulator [Cellulomonas composti]|uniref:LysR family transcriptional regulator n=1 Tax=Cellulomonas composti TaxID=266130 RepID=A0A511JEA6_9CELL|nr:LysR family transcriptional regulator [Cellulomonas composti]GEL96347.1 LysR family transcriptional regulator [Cellulomonas composti]